MANKFIGEPSVELRSEQPYVAIPIRATLLEWDEVNALTEEIFKWLGRKGIEAAGAPFYRYWVVGDMDESFDLEVGVPIGRMAAGDERVIASFIPGGSYVTAVHKGHPDQLEYSWEALEKWAAKEGMELDKRWEQDIEIWNGRFEFYLADPKNEPDLNNWSIEIAYLLMRDDAA